MSSAVLHWHWLAGLGVGQGPVLKEWAEVVGQPLMQQLGLSVEPPQQPGAVEPV